MLSVEIRVKGVSDVINATDAQIEKWQEELAYRIPEESRRLMDESVPAGRVYRRGGIRGRHIRGLKRVRGTKTRGIVGNRFHRASTPGQPIAEDTGRSYRDIKVVRMKKGSYRVRFGGWTGYWEFEVKESRQRRTIIPAIEAAVQKTFR